MPSASPALAMSAPNRRETGIYFVNGWVDNFLIGGIAILGYVILRVFPEAYSTRLSITCLALGNWPHLVCTWQRVYESRDTVRRFRHTAVTLPLISLALLALSIWYPGSVGRVVVLTYVVWAIYHFQAQCFGILLIYVYRAGIRVSRGERRVLVSFTHAIWACGCFVFLRLLLPEQMHFTISAFPVPIIFAAKLWLAASACLVGVVLVRWSKRVKKVPLAPVSVSLLTQYLMALKAPASAFLTINGAFHGLQYIFIAWAYQSRRHTLETGKPARGRFTLGWYGRMFGGGLIWYGGALLYARLLTHVTGQPPAVGIVIAVAGVNLVHFYADTFIWKLRDNEPYAPAPILLGA